MVRWNEPYKCNRGAVCKILPRLEKLGLRGTLKYIEGEAACVDYIQIDYLEYIRVDLLIPSLLLIITIYKSHDLNFETVNDFILHCMKSKYFFKEIPMKKQKLTMTDILGSEENLKKFEKILEQYNMTKELFEQDEEEIEEENEEEKFDYKTQDEIDENICRFTLRIPIEFIQKIDKIRIKKGIKKSRNQWILEAILENLMNK
jgi:hypothetical protein